MPYYEEDHVPEAMAHISPEIAWAAWLLAPISGIPVPLPAAPAPRQEVLQLLRRNKVPLLWLRGDDRPQAAWLYAWEGWRAALEEEEARLQAQRAAFAEVNEAWKAQGIRPVLIKSLGPPPSFPYTSDNVDALVPVDRALDARAALRRLGYVELRHLEEPNKYLFKRFHAGREVSAIHVHGQVEWHVPFLDARRVARDARQAEDDLLVWAPHPSDGLAIVWAHALYENKGVRLVDLARAGYALRQPDFEWGRVFATAERTGWLDGLAGMLWLWDALVRALSGRSPLPSEVMEAARQMAPAAFVDALDRQLHGPVSFPFPIPFKMSKRLFLAKMWRSPDRAPRQRLKDIVVHVVYGTRRRMGIRSQPGAVYAISGLDGSGKTTQARALRDAFEQCGLRVDYVWGRPGSSSFVAGMMRLVRGARGHPVEGEDRAAREIARARRFHQPWVRALWPWVVGLDLTMIAITRIWPRLWLGRVVVADRYVLDALADLAARLGGTGVWRHPAIRLASRLTPRPRVAFLLELSPEAAFDRKGGDEWLPLLQTQAEAYRRLAEGRDVYRVDAERPWGMINDEIVRWALSDYLDRFWTRLNAILLSNPKPLSAALRQAAQSSTES